MRQLVGLSCVLCSQRIGSELDARFCDACGSPVHKKCMVPSAASEETGLCATCGAAPELAAREQQLHQEHEEVRNRVNRPLNPKVCIAAMIGFGMMAISGCLTTFRPHLAEGRAMDTRGFLGFDIFMLIGIAGVAYFAYRYAQSQQV